MTTETAVAKVGSAPIELKGTTGEFEVIFATKRDAQGNLVIDLDGDVYGDDVVGEQSVLIGCWNHGDSCPGPAGMAKTRESDRDIRAIGRLFTETRYGADEYRRWQALGDQAKFSYIYRILEADYGVVNGRDVRRLLKLDVISVDLVASPAGRTALVSLKSCDSCATCPHSGVCKVADTSSLLAQVVDEARETQARIAVQNEARRYQTIRAQLDRDAIEREAKANREPATIAEWRVHAPLVVQAAKQAVRLAAAELGIPVPEVRWLDDDETNHREILGLARKSRPDVIYLQTGRSERECAKTALHEVFHLAQFANHVEGDLEPDAHAFAERLIDRVFLFDPRRR